MTIKRKTVGWAVAGVAALALTGFVAWKMSQPDEVVVWEVTSQTIEKGISVVGRVRPDDLVQVSSPNPGQVIRLLADDGDVVAAGTALAVIRANVEQAQTEADLARERAARAEVTEARLNFNRTKTLHDRGFAADAALDNARIALQSAEANLAAASAQVKASAERAREFIILAPMDGVVLFRPIDNGQVVGAGETLFEMGSSSGAEIQAEVEEAYADALRPGMMARAAVSGSEAVFSARVTEVAPRVNASTGARLIKLRPDGNAGLSPGRSVDLTVVVETREGGITIPRRAVVDATTSPKVYTIGSDDRIEQREIEIERWPSTNAIITKGVSAGSVIVLDPAKVGVGQRVRPIMTDGQ